MGKKAKPEATKPESTWEQKLAAAEASAVAVEKEYADAHQALLDKKAEMRNQGRFDPIIVRNMEKNLQDLLAKVEAANEHYYEVLESGGLDAEDDLSNNTPSIKKKAAKRAFSGMY